MTIPVPVSSCGYDSEHMAVFSRLMRTIFRSLTGRLTRYYVSEDACGKSSLSNGMPRSRRNVWNVPERVDNHTQPLGLTASKDFYTYVRGCGSSPELYTVSESTRLKDEYGETIFVIY
jgi:hypothetical protein